MMATMLRRIGRARERQRIADADVGQERRGHERHQRRCRDETRRNTDADEQDAMPEYQAEDASSARTESHPHADFPRALRHRVAGDAVESDRRQPQRQQAEGRQGDHVGSQRRQGVEHLVFERADVEDRERRVDLLHGATDGAGERGGVALGPYMERCLRRVVLEDRLVDERDRLFSHAVVFAVLRHADDRREVGVAEELESLADGVVVRPEALGHRLVHDDDERCAHRVGPREVTAAGKRDADCLEVAGADRVHLHENPVARRRVLAFRKHAAEQAPGERRTLGDRGVPDARESRHARGRLLVEDLAARGRVAFAAQIEVHHEDAARLESGVGPLGPRQAAEERAGGHEGDERQRDLRDHQHLTQRKETTQSSMRRASRHHLVLEDRHDVRLRRLDGGREAEDHAGRHRENGGEGQDTRVNREILPDRQRQLQIRGDERVEEPVGEQQSEAAAGQREQRAFGDELPYQPKAPRAEREPERDFLAAARGAPEQEVRDVRARDEQDDANHRHQDHRQADDWRSGLALRIQARIEQRHRARASSFVVDGKGLLQTGEHRSQLG